MVMSSGGAFTNPVKDTAELHDGNFRSTKAGFVFRCKAASKPSGSVCRGSKVTQQLMSTSSKIEPHIGPVGSMEIWMGTARTGTVCFCYLLHAPEGNEVCLE